MATNEPTTTPLPARRVPWRSLATVVAGLTLAGGITAASAAPSAQGGAELPPVTISSTTLRAGETISISGTGCVDPDTGTGDGLEVVLVVPIDAGRGGTGYRPTVRAEANADGNFAGSGVVDQPFFPTGDQTGFFTCQEKSEDFSGPSLAQRPVQLTIEAPSLPDLTVAAGATIDYELPCSILGGEYGRFHIYGTADGLEDLSLSVAGTFPQETSPQEGQQVQLQVPAEASPGVYDATASCGVTQAGTSAYFTGFTVTVTASDPAPAPPGPGSEAPEAATPVAGAPNYTG